MSKNSAKAAEVYSDVVRLLDASGVPPNDRAEVLAYIVQVIGMDKGTFTPRVLQ